MSKVQEKRTSKSEWQDLGRCLAVILVGEVIHLRRMPKAIAKSIAEKR